MLDINQSTQSYVRTPSETERYLTLEGPYRHQSDFTILFGIIVVVSLISVVVWRCVW